MNCPSPESKKVLLAFAPLPYMPRFLFMQTKASLCRRIHTRKPGAAAMRHVSKVTGKPMQDVRVPLAGVAPCPTPKANCANIVVRTVHLGESSLKCLVLLMQDVYSWTWDGPGG